MIQVPFYVNDRCLSPHVRDFSIYYESTNELVVTTQDGTEHEFGHRVRPVIQFRLQLSREHSDDEFRMLLQNRLTVGCDYPDFGFLRLPFRLDCNLQKALECWNCVDDSNYYSSGFITLRCKEVLSAKYV